MELLERVGDFFNAMFTGFDRFMTRRFGASNERFLKRMGYIRNKQTQEVTVIPGSILDRINQQEAQIAQLTDEQLLETATQLRARLKQGESLDDILPDAFARVREAGKRFLRMRHYDVQLIGGYALHKGMISEMRTGEGKTLVATLPAFLNALAGKVHLVTVNDYLARRDMEWMAPVYLGLGLKVGAIQSNMGTQERADAYACDITYGTNNEFGFDYLRDNMKPRADLQVQGPLDFAIVDEIDNILIDEARTPLIISGAAHDDVTKYARANRVAIQLKKGEHFEVKEKEHTCSLTDEGIRVAEELAGVESFYTAGNMEWPHLIDNSLKAHHLYKRDVNYVVQQGKVIIVDEFTGRLMDGRQWSDGLHQAVEAKEGVQIKEESQTLATITLQNFFKLYKKLGGMTGTAMTEAGEFLKIYGLEILSIPTNRPTSRVDESDLVFRTEREKFDAIVEEIREVHKTGRPILVGTVSIEKSELLSHKLTRVGVKHAVLNAKHHERESEIIAQAGRLNGVTIATNMAGRGTDIILGGNPEPMAWEILKQKYRSRIDVPKVEWDTLSQQIADQEGMKAEGRQVADIGGLHVIGSERHEARRIDLQLRGRAGRQGDPGSSRFFLSLEDDLLRIFGGETIKGILAWAGMQDGEAIEHPWLNSRIEKAQKKVEERNFEIRKNLLEYDELMDNQRKRVYSYRQHILEGGNCRELIVEMFRQQLKHWVPQFLSQNYGTDTCAKWAEHEYGIQMDVRDLRGLEAAQIQDRLVEQAQRQAEQYLRDQMESDLPEHVEKEWERNWQAFSKWVNTRYGLNTNDSELKKIGRDNIFEAILPRIHEAIGRYDFTPLQTFCDEVWGRRSLCGWLKEQTALEFQPEEFQGQSHEDAQQNILVRVLAEYDRKELEFPVAVGLAQFMADRGVAGTERYNRPGLAEWAAHRFELTLPAEVFEGKSKETIRGELQTLSTQFHQGEQTREQVLERINQAYGPSVAEDSSLDRIREARVADDLAAWAQHDFRAKVTSEQLLELTRAQAQQTLLSQHDQHCRPELLQTERSLILDVLDAAWKDHLYFMDHLRQGVGLAGYAGKDPKVEFKREGMRAFEAMWRRIGEQVTSSIFRVEEMSPEFVGDLWRITSVRHEAAQSVMEIEEQSQSFEDDTSPEGGEDKAVEPIRNFGERVGRNDPCPCGSGKKHKNCCLKK